MCGLLLSCQPSSASLLPAVISVVAAVPYISLLLLPPRVPLTNWSWCLTGVFAVVQMFALSLSIYDKQTWLWMSLWCRADSFSQVALVTRECESRNYLLSDFIIRILSRPRPDRGRDGEWKGEQKEDLGEGQRGTDRATDNKIQHCGINRSMCLYVCVCVGVSKCVCVCMG